MSNNKVFETKLPQQLLPIIESQSIKEQKMSSRKVQLMVEPAEKVVFAGEAARGVEIKTQLKITNKTDTKQAFKVKCTRNDLFKIRPATGILDYNQTAVVALSYKGNGEPVEEEKLHFGIYHIPAPEGCTCEGAWAEHYGPAQGELRLRVAFQQ